MRNQDVLTAPQVAEMCGVTTKTVHRWIKANYFPGAYKGLGKTSPYCIPRDEVEAFVERTSEGVKVRWQSPFSQAAQEEPCPEAGSSEPVDERTSLLTLQVAPQLEKCRSSALFALIIEDDLDAGYLFEFALRGAGFTTVLAESGARALSFLASMVPDLIVLDLGLPDLPGMQILQRIRANEQLTEVPVIVATAHPEMARRIEEQADLALLKPVRFQVLRSKAVELTHPHALSA